LQTLKKKQKNSLEINQKKIKKKNPTKKMELVGSNAPRSTTCTCTLKSWVLLHMHTEIMGGSTEYNSSNKGSGKVTTKG